MAIGSSLGITLPTQGGNTGTWGSDLNSELNKIIDAVEGQVPSNALDISGNLDFNDFAAAEVAYTSYTQQSSDPSALNSIFFGTDNEMYVRDGANNVIKITNNGTVSNVAAGNIGNSGTDYGTGTIVLDWDGTRYNAWSSLGTYAEVRSAGSVYESTGGNSITVKPPAVVSADYTLTLPNGPSEDGVMVSDASGNLSFTDTLEGVKVNDGIFNHSDRPLYISGAAVVPATSNSSRMWFDIGEGACKLNTAAGAMSIAINIPINGTKTITSIELLHGGSDTASAKVYTRDFGSFASTPTLEETTVVPTTLLNGGSGPQYIVEALDLLSGPIIGAGLHLGTYITLESTSTGGAIYIHGILVYYSQSV